MFERMSEDMDINCGTIAEGKEKVEYELKLAETLANSGYGKEAADLFLTCASQVDSTEVIPIKRKAAEYYLNSGHMEEGIKTLNDVASDVGMVGCGMAFEA